MDKRVGQFSSVWDNGLPAIAVEYPQVRTENISGNASAFSGTTPDEFKCWWSDTNLDNILLSDPDYDNSYIDEINNGPD